MILLWFAPAFIATAIAVIYVAYQERKLGKDDEE